MNGRGAGDGDSRRGQARVGYSNADIMLGLISAIREQMSPDEEGEG